MGKFAVAHALKAEGVDVKGIAMTSRATAPAKFDFYVDVTSKTSQAELKKVFAGLPLTKVHTAGMPHTQMFCALCT